MNEFNSNVTVVHIFCIWILKLGIYLIFQVQIHGNGNKIIQMVINSK